MDNEESDEYMVADPFILDQSSDEQEIVSDDEALDAQIEEFYSVFTYQQYISYVQFHNSGSRDLGELNDEHTDGYDTESAFRNMVDPLEGDEEDGDDLKQREAFSSFVQEAIWRAEQLSILEGGRPENARARPRSALNVRSRPQSAGTMHSLPAESRSSPYLQRITRRHEPRKRPTSAATSPLPPLVQQLLDSTESTYPRETYVRHRPPTPTQARSSTRSLPQREKPATTASSDEDKREWSPEHSTATPMTVSPTIHSSTSRLRRPSVFSQWTGYSTGTGASAAQRSQAAQAKKLAAQAVREREWHCMKALEEANGLERQFKAIRGHDGDLRVRICEDDHIVREVAPERLHREVRRLKATAVQRQATRQPSPPPRVQRHPAEEERRITREEQRTVLLETLRLTGKLREQLAELQKRGGRFSPFV